MGRLFPVSQRATITEKPPKESYLLVAFISVLVVVHFLFSLAVPLAFIYNEKSLSHLSENVFNIWLCQPIFLAAFLAVVRSKSHKCKVLVYIDVGVSVLQKMIIFLL